MSTRTLMMQGNIAVAEGAIDAGCRFFAGYPITPSSEIAEQLSKRLPELGGRFIQMEDEIAAMGAVIGASLGGSKSLTATSGPLTPQTAILALTPLSSRHSRIALAMFVNLLRWLSPLPPFSGISEMPHAVTA